MFEHISVVLSDHTLNVDRFLSLLMQIHTSAMPINVILHEHVESWILLAEKMEDSRVMSLISNTLCVLARRGMFPMSTKEAEMLLEILYRSTERWVDRLSGKRTHQSENVLSLLGENRQVSSCLSSIFLCVASVQKRNLLKKRSTRWLPLIYSAMRENIDCGNGVQVLLLGLCEKRSEYRCLKDLTMYCKLLSSIRKLKAENYSELVRIFQNMKEITLHAREEPMNWQLFCSQSLKHILEGNVEVLKMETLYREDSIFAYLCGLFFDKEMHVEMSEFLCEMIALAISARSSEESNYVKCDSFVFEERLQMDRHSV